ncbi:MAG: hypothetical protein ACO1O4_01160 [Devosia sp.]
MEPTKTDVITGATGTSLAGLPGASLNVGAIVLRDEQVPKAQAMVDGLDFGAVASGDIVNMGLEAEQSLQRTLDGFLARLDKNSAAKLFDLFGRLEQGVDDAKLPEILQRLHEGEKPGFISGLFARFTGKSSDKAMRDFMEEIGSLISGRTQTLATKMGQIEGELSGEMQKLFGELRSLDQLKQAYAAHFSDFTVAAAAARGFLDKARAYVETETAKVTTGDVTAQTRLRELEDKLRLLESRALALEGVYTRLPADQIVIQQIEQAGIATLQETATTIASRFASIKMTLLSIHGAFAVKSVQQLSERQARMDEQLQKLRSATLKDVAVSAASAPGQNRLAQAEQIENIVASTKEIHALIETAKQQSDQKFATARQKFAQARAELATLT